MKLFGIIVIGLIVILAGWRYLGGRVDRSDPSQVAAAFIKELKAEHVKDAAGYWVPDGAEAWTASAEKQIKIWPSGMSTRFFEGLPAKPVFTKVENAKAPANVQTVRSGETSIELKQLDGKWYVCKGPL